MCCHVSNGVLSSSGLDELGHSIILRVIIGVEAADAAGCVSTDLSYDGLDTRCFELGGREGGGIGPLNLLEAEPEENAGLVFD